TFQTRLDHGSGCPQLMGSVGRETTLHLYRLDQALEANIDGCDEGLNLAGRLVDLKGFVSVARRGTRRLQRKLTQRLQGSPHTGGASDEGGDTDDRRRPGGILEEIKQLTHQPGSNKARLGTAEVHEQPGHLQQCANRKDDPQSPTELRNKRIAVEHHCVSFKTSRRYPNPRCVSISIVAFRAASCLLRWWMCTGIVLVSGGASAP